MCALVLLFFLLQRDFPPPSLQVRSGVGALYFGIGAGVCWCPIGGRNLWFLPVFSVIVCSSVVFLVSSFWEKKNAPLFHLLVEKGAVLGEFFVCIVGGASRFLPSIVHDPLEGGFGASIPLVLSFPASETGCQLLAVAGKADQASESTWTACCSFAKVLVYCHLVSVDWHSCPPAVPGTRPPRVVGSLAVGYQGLGNLAWVRLAGILAFELPQVPDLRGPLAVFLPLVKVSV